MSATKSLTNFYGSFFWKCAKFAICPYRLTINAFLDSEDPDPNDLALGIGACLVLSTIVPILPTITSLTIAIASIAAVLALASMFVTYPLTILSDACRSEHSYRHEIAF
ncbi:hypothetical protein OQJ18_05095 [Fluoribacter dumoffii]|uniref:Uncharacterized protein n=1 Tax=Fluoribacter dumoffii TaxID=463 RepID=A0A377G9X9_9GAMM|nr:hypothetical protein [Fluoribacter dumoffii]KTC90192.1 hypothetical protein Ldum_1260 [Fluoribacter dumoffii NY 23]MCW8385487.1 hypothetical protein [Fluoribacter dumoffii]MCW8418538.1 hypothetical protein [Fluoribacter dumoffii]MCW8453620.1 hypothetical protein [Fluoribacter dumoffii]MCW8459162.1 hypothetical protein [Fluoribacter dumoffii]